MNESGISPGTSTYAGAPVVCASLRATAASTSIRYPLAESSARESVLRFASL